MKRKIISVFTAVMMFLITITGSVSELSFPVSAADVPKKVLILGDSISTGYGLADTSTESFGALIDASKDIDLTNLAVNGDTSEGLLDKLDNNAAAKSAVQNSDIIMVSIGGNDVLGLLLNDIKTALGLQPTATAAEIQAALAEPAKQMTLVMWANGLSNPAYDRTAYDNAVSAFTANFSAIVARIKALNPNAQLCFQTIYNPFNGTFSGNLPLLLTPLSTFAETIIPNMNTVINGSTASGYVVADTYTALSGNAQTYTNIISFDIHPNAAGHSVIASLITATSLDFTLKTISDITVDTVNRQIFANGHPIIIRGGIGSDTRIYMDKGIIGTYEDGTDTIVDLTGLTGDTTNGYDLSSCEVFGGSGTDAVPSTKITMLGGIVLGIYGGGNNGAVNGDCSIYIKGGRVNYIYGGGCFGNVSGAAIVKIGVDANIIGSITGKGAAPAAAVGTGSQIEYEVAFYNVKNGTKYSEVSNYPPQWVTAGQSAARPSTTPVLSGKMFDGWRKVADDSIFNFTDTVSAPIKLYPRLIDAAVTIDNNNMIFANGLPIIIIDADGVSSTINDTLIYIDKNSNGQVDTTETAEVIPGANGNNITGYELGYWPIYGGSYLGDVISTKITMLSGNLLTIHGGGYQGNVNGNTQINLNSGDLHFDLFGGGYYSIIGGSTNININGGTVGCDVYGGSYFGSVDGNTNIAINKGTVDCVFGGGNNSNVAGIASLKIGVDSNIKNFSTYLGTFGTVGAGSHVEYEVAFYDGTTKLTTPVAQWITSGGTVAKPTNPTKSNYTFSKWLDGGIEFNYGTLITSPKKLTASWSAVPVTHTVTYNGNGNTSGTVPTDINTYTNGANVPLAGNTGNLAKTGYTFGGWSLTPNGSAISSHAMGTAPVTFYAVWNANISSGDSGNSGSSSSSDNSGSSGNSSSSGSTTNTSKEEPALDGNGGTGKTITNKLEDAKTGDKVTIDMNGSTTLKAEWLKAIAGKDVDIVLDMGNGVKWTINGTSITGTNFKDTDLAITKGTNKIPVKVINNITGKTNVMQFTVTHSGEFGFTAVLSIDLGKDNEGLYANLFYYNETTKTLEFIGACKIGKGGSAAWELTHTSSYAIIIDKVSLDPEDVAAGAGITADGSLDYSNVTDNKNKVIVFVVLVLISAVLFAVQFKKHRTSK